MPGPLRSDQTPQPEDDPALVLAQHAHRQNAEDEEARNEKRHRRDESMFASVLGASVGTHAREVPFPPRSDFDLSPFATATADALDPSFSVDKDLADRILG